VVAGAYQVDVLLLGDLIGKLAPRLGTIIDGISFNTVACVDEEEISAFGIGPVVKVFCEGDVVTPVS
jgi:hypothetical protein